MHTAGLAMNMLADDDNDDDDDDDENPTHGPSAEGLREQLTAGMTIAALLAGFAVGLATTVSSDEIRAYARWELRTFLGRNSTLCEKYEPLGLIETDGGPTHGLRTCNPDSGCWDGYAAWGTRAPDSPLVRHGLDQCSARAEGLFFEDLVLAKEVTVDQDLGRNTMIVIWVTMIVEMLGTVLFFSLLTQTSEGGDVAIWHSTFGVFLHVLYFLPVFNFYNFLMLASRVVKVKFVHCDDDFTGACWVEETPTFNRLALAACVLVVAVLALQTRLSWRLAAKRAEAAKQAVAKRALTRARTSRFSPGLLSRQASSLSKGAGEASSPLPPASAAASARTEEECQRPCSRPDMATAMPGEAGAREASRLGEGGAEPESRSSPSLPSTSSRSSTSSGVPSAEPAEGDESVGLRGERGSTLPETSRSRQ
mmetsp:Transcript_9051/g.28644  ORF Transcript_9051/g.28644 Transcript_9051/m.28644 type:complete len:423 (-) Transcript_9051:435-1703(-)